MYSKEWIKLNYKEFSLDLNRKYDHELYDFHNTFPIKTNNNRVLITQYKCIHDKLLIQSLDNHIKNNDTNVIFHFDWTNTNINIINFIIEKHVKYMYTTIMSKKISSNNKINYYVIIEFFDRTTHEYDYYFMNMYDFISKYKSQLVKFDWCKNYNEFLNICNTNNKSYCKLVFNKIASMFNNKNRNNAIYIEA